MRTLTVVVRFRRIGREVAFAGHPEIVVRQLLVRFNRRLHFNERRPSLEAVLARMNCDRGYLAEVVGHWRLEIDGTPTCRHEDALVLTGVGCTSPRRSRVERWAAAARWALPESRIEVIEAGCEHCGGGEVRCS